MTQVFFVAGTGISSISFRMDLKEGLTRKTDLLLNINRNNLHFVSDGDKGGAD